MDGQRMVLQHGFAVVGAQPHVRRGLWELLLAHMHAGRQAQHATLVRTRTARILHVLHDEMQLLCTCLHCPLRACGLSSWPAVGITCGVARALPSARRRGWQQQHLIRTGWAPARFMRQICATVAARRVLMRRTGRWLKGRVVRRASIAGDSMCVLHSASTMAGWPAVAVNTHRLGSGSVYAPDLSDSGGTACINTADGAVAQGAGCTQG
jgi:hypothetical protein